MSKLVNQGFSAVRWGAFSSVARFGLQIFAQAIMARALGPEIYGVFGMGLVVLTFANFFAEFGFGWSLIYRKSLTPDDVRFVFTCQLFTGILVAIGLYACAGLIASYFREPRVDLVVKWISITCVLSAAAAPSVNLLAREMRFRESGLAQVLSYFVGYVLVGIPLALSNYGVSALIASWVAQSSVRLIASYWLVRHPLRLLMVHPEARSLITSGSLVFLTNITNWLLANIDRMLVGRVLSASSMGLYTVGANLANTPNGLLLSALQPAFLSAGAKLSHDPEQLRSAYGRILSAAFVLTMPVYAVLAVVAPSIVEVLYGSRWSGAAPVMTILFLAMPAFIVWGVSTPVLWNTGRASHEAVVQWPILLGAGALLLQFSKEGVVVVAAIVALTIYVRGAVICIWACRAVALPPRYYALDIVRGLLLSIICAGCAFLARGAFDGFPAIISLLAASSISAMAGILMVFWVPGLLGANGSAVLVRMVPRAARWLSVRRSTP